LRPRGAQSVLLKSEYRNTSLPNAAYCFRGGEVCINICGKKIYEKRRLSMPTFMMLGKYTPEALKGISPERTDKAVELIRKNGGKVISMYSVLGEQDLVFILDFPDAEKALVTSVALNRLTGISFTTSPVVEVEKFDKLIGQ
jgi:uncharacterized protein with GYD domain